MRRRLAIVAIGIVAGVVAITTTLALASSPHVDADERDATYATVAIERRNLVQRETVDGTLGYDDERLLYAQASGTLTQLARAGKIARRGDPLYWIDGRPVVLFYGSTPLWRRLDASSASGRDIEELERNLVRLGYDPYGAIAIDEDWTAATTAAVKRWQADMDLATSGVVELGTIAMLSGPRRVGQASASVGSLIQPGAEILATTSRRRIVVVDLDAAKRSLVTRGDRVGVVLPDGSPVSGRITGVGKVAESQADPESGQESDPTIKVKIKLAPSARGRKLDSAPVSVSIARETARNVLSVPVNALLALAEGGYAVEVVDGDGTTQLVRVTPGMFADGFVEISGAGVRANRKVVVPA